MSDAEEARGGPRPDEDPMVIAAIAEDRRPADDIWLIDCPACGWPSYWNQGSHASCRNCGEDLSGLTDEAYTLDAYWCDAEYPCDELERQQRERDET